MVIPYFIASVFEVLVLFFFVILIRLNLYKQQETQSIIHIHIKVLKNLKHYFVTFISYLLHTTHFWNKRHQVHSKWNIRKPNN